MEVSVMYGILIVDDNSLVRMSLVNLISWKQHNATLVAIAHDGNEAFRLCEASSTYCNHRYKNARL